MNIQKKLNNIPWFHFILPLSFFLAEISIICFYYRFEFNPDEGINLIKAFLIYYDFELYRDIWSDQPPLLTNILAFIFNIFEPNVNSARLIILFFSTVLLWQVWLILYLFGGVLHAYIGCFFLIISPQYWRLSISVMIGLPCITLTTGAIISIILWHVNKSKGWLITSALLLSLSIATKLFTLFVALIIVIGILIDIALNHARSSWHKKLQHPAIWLITFLGFSSLLFLFQVGVNNFHFLIGNHAGARNIGAFQDIDLGRSMKNDYRIFLIGFAVWATIIAWQRRQWQILYFTAWFASSYLLLINHRPVWHHHVLLLLVPAIILVGYGIGEIITKQIKLDLVCCFKRNKIMSIFILAVSIVTILLIGEQTKTTAKEIDGWLIPNNKNEIAAQIDEQFLVEIIKLKPQTDWIFTDSPMFAFRADIPIPPSTAVLSQKQIITENITESKLINVINLYQPQQILLKRFPWLKLTKAIDRDYELIKKIDNYRLYLRKDRKD